MFLKVLLVDDNRYALNNFSNLVNWEELGFSLIGTATDGIEGMELYEQYHPDLIITDVQMPGIDGRELARLVKQKTPDTEIIFLSSYDEFDYARAAVDLKVHGYLLKQELTRDILAAKLKTIRDHFSEKMQNAHQQIKSSLTTCFRMSVNELESEGYPDRKLCKGSAFFFIIEQDHIPEQIALQSDCQVKEAQYNRIFPQLSAQIPELTYLIRAERFIWIAITDDRKDSEKSALVAASFLREHESENFSVYLCGKVETIMDCRKRYEELKYLSKQRYFEGPQCVLYADLFDPPQKIPKTHMEALLKMADSIWDTEINDLDEFLSSIYKPLLHQQDFDSFIRMTCHILHAINKQLRKNGQPFDLYDEETFYLLSAKRIIRWIKSKIILIREFIHPVYSDMTMRVMDYIHQNYSNPLLSVEMIADIAGLSINRMNDILKKDLGQTARKYLAEIRTEKACRLLEKGLPIQQVAEQTGYSTPSYFSHVFHKSLGISPQEYQRTKRKNGAAAP